MHQLLNRFVLPLLGWLTLSCDGSLPPQRVQTDTLEATKMSALYHQDVRSRMKQKKSTDFSSTGSSLSRDSSSFDFTQEKNVLLKSDRTQKNTVYKQAKCTDWRVLTKIHKTKVWVSKNGQEICFESGMSIDADGSPKAYHPKNIGLDDLKYAGKNGKWWAVATRNGKPVVQKSGYYVSTTSLQDFRYTPWDQRRYVDAEKIPYIVLPPKIKKMGAVALGDVAVVYNTLNHTWTYAIYADTGANTRIGEGSIALAKLLGINADARRGGVQRGVVYLVFPKSGLGKPLSLARIQALGSSRFYKFGGLTRLKTYLHNCTNIGK